MIDQQAAAASGWRDRHWQTDDGLQLHYRDYAGPEGSDEIPALCVPGLTCNVRDFHDLAMHLAMRRRVVTVDLRGRGDSEYAKDSGTYIPLQYAQDVQRLFPAAGMEQAVLVGSSLGGLVTMVLAMMEPQRIAGVVLNDIGPVVELRGLERIAEYVGLQRSYPTWMHAARAMQDTRKGVYPDWGLSDWLAEAKRAMELGGNGRITYDYDMRIGDAFASGRGQDKMAEAAKIEFWDGFDALAGKPVLVVRGENSDILSGRTARDMVDRFADVELVSIGRVGHLPTLAEADALAAIDRLFDERLPSARADR
ncbi:alpha/beta hydrolase [Croceicoccus ponticola]|uniref:Alpha/beta hydrolase n=1 Tax=Croceicoccus ponticola TaxID=2217664 RepID=A0A437H1L6_9SPHN|nr:alpha/beta hydrolase [Croceicoccus ponticola]RVQ69547.1 alpha/beta hydrolase [Croceicoccus ponticola]